MQSKSLYDLTEWEHEREVKEYILDNFSEHTQKKAVKAIQDLLEQRKSWKWMHYALLKKSVGEYEKWGFGLWFTDLFNACVCEAMVRDEKLADTSYADARKWLLSYEEQEQEQLDSDTTGELNDESPWIDRKQQVEALPRVRTRLPNGALESYRPLEELAESCGATLEAYLDFLSSSNDNAEYIEHETRRLGIIRRP